MFREIKPCAALSDFVDCYWWHETSAPAASKRVLPDGCVDVLFDLTGERFSGGLVVGTMTRSFEYSTAGPERLFAVRFRPGGAVPFLRVPMADLTDRHVDVDALWRPDGVDAERLARSRSAGARRALLEAALLERRDQGPAPDARIRHAIDLIERDGGATPIGDINKAVGLSRQHLTRLFNHHVGITPKRFQRVLRMQRLLDAVKVSPPTSWCEAALDGGFYDQAHMIAEFRAHTGATPSAMFHSSKTGSRRVR